MSTEKPPPSKRNEDFPIIEDIDIISVIGRGAFSTVYRGRQKLLDRQVAIKVLSTEKLNDSSYLSTFSTRQASKRRAIQRQ